MKISVIVPVYNAEKYLKKCLLSVINQTYKDWELILVDDGSTDKSPQIIDNIGKRDARIKVIHQKNAGPGVARNHGLEIAMGDYIVFLDSDDFIDKEYFELLVPKAEKSDVVFVDINQISEKGKILTKEPMSIYKSWEKEKILRAQMTGKIPWGGVRKCVKTELLKKNHITYTAHSIGEEALYSFRIMLAANSVSFIDEKPVYFYVNHENSQSKLKMDDPWGQIVECLRDYFIENKLYQYYANTLNAFNLTATVVSLDRIEQMYEGHEKQKKAKARIKKCLKLYDRSAGIDYGSMSRKAKVFVPFVLREKYEVVLWASKLRNIVK